MPPKLLVIYHGKCIDGFTAAWVVWKARKGDGEYHAGAYGEPPPCVDGREVVLVDFSYPSEVMERLIADADSLLCLDHHKTADKALAGLPGCHFDMNRSGAMMAWNHYFPGGYVPEVIKYVQDRDLWQNKMPRTEEVNAYVRSWPYDFDQWSSFEHKLQDDYKFACAVGDGEAILRYQAQSIANHCDHAKVRVFAGAVNDVVVVAGGRELDAIPMVNCTDRSIVSKLGHELCVRAETEWSSSWRDEGSLRVFTLTSIGDVDVSDIAKRQGGGGHKGAAGFTKALPQL